MSQWTECSCVVGASASQEYKSGCTQYMQRRSYLSMEVEKIPHQSAVYFPAREAAVSMLRVPAILTKICVLSQSIQLSTLRINILFQALYSFFQFQMRLYFVHWGNPRQLYNRCLFLSPHSWIFQTTNLTTKWLGVYAVGHLSEPLFRRSLHFQCQNPCGH